MAFIPTILEFISNIYLQGQVHKALPITGLQSKAGNNAHEPNLVTHQILWGTAAGEILTQTVLNGA